MSSYSSLRSSTTEKAEGFSVSINTLNSKGLGFYTENFKVSRNFGHIYIND